MGSGVARLRKVNSTTENANKVFNSVINNDHFIYDVYAREMCRLPEVQQRLDIKDAANPTEAEERRLRALSKSVRHFVEICIEFSLNGRKKEMQRFCMLAGSRHIKYSKEPFESSQWEAFLQGTTDLLEGEKKRPAKKEIDAWQEYMRSVIECMRTGYDMATEKGKPLTHDDVTEAIDSLRTRSTTI